MTESASPPRCSDCDRDFTDEVEREIHGYLRHAVQPSWFEEPGKRGHTSVCPDCGERWGRGLGLTVHQGVAHRAPRPLPAPTDLSAPFTPSLFRFGGHRSRHDAPSSSPSPQLGVSDDPDSRHPA